MQHNLYTNTFILAKLNKYLYRYIKHTDTWIEIDKLNKKKGGRDFIHGENVKVKIKLQKNWQVKIYEQRKKKKQQQNIKEIKVK